MILVDVVIALVLGAAVGLVVAKMIRDKKSGKVGSCGCGCSCSGCTGCGSKALNRNTN